MLSGRSILLLDEPTADLDEATAATIRSVLDRLATDHLVIVATHDAALVAMAETALAGQRRIMWAGITCAVLAALSAVGLLAVSGQFLAGAAIAGVSGGPYVMARAGLLHDVVEAMAGATSEAEVRDLRHRLGVRPVFKRIDSCAAEFEA
eukprot:gene15630-19789_t